MRGNQMQKINVNLYGGKGIFSGKERPLEADIIFCDKANKCSLYKENKCLNCRSLEGLCCREGKIETKKGYTSKAAKYYQFYNKYKSDECFHKLSYPNNFVWLIDDTLYIKLCCVRVYKPKEQENYRVNKWGYVIEDNYFGTSYFTIKLQEINVDLLSLIFSYKPSAFLGGTNRTYQQKIVPNIIRELKTLVPKVYQDLVDRHSKYEKYIKNPDYVGKYALMKTLVDGSEIVDGHGNKAIKKGDFLYCQNFKKGFVPFDGESAECTIKIPDDKLYQITNNNQWDENTIFE